jgi:hypothetical protein
MLVFCIVHLKRNFAKKFGNHEARYIVLNNIFAADTREQLSANMLSIYQLYPQIKSWIVNKQPQWLLCGLTRSESKVPIAYWTFARKHTSNGESSHFQKNNFTGRKTSLLNAVLKYVYVLHMLRIY